MCVFYTSCGYESREVNPPTMGGGGDRFVEIFFVFAPPPTAMNAGHERLVLDYSLHLLNFWQGVTATRLATVPATVSCRQSLFIFMYEFFHVSS